MITFKQFLQLDEGPRDPQLGDVYDPAYLYHTTDAKKLDSIKTHGLGGAHPSTFDGYENTKGLVCFAPTLDATEYWHGMVNHQVTGSIQSSDKTVLLRVHKDKVEQIKSRRYDEVLVKYVPPEHIERLVGKQWKAL